MVARVLILTALLLISSTSFALTARVDRSALAQNETLTLQLQSDSHQDLSTLDLTQLRNDFEVINRSTQSSINIINSESRLNTTMTLSLKPLRQGQLQIPEFELAGERSRAISVFVTEPKAVASTTQDRAVFIETEIDKTALFRGEQLLYTLRILTATELSNASLPAFELDGAEVETLPEQRYQRTLNGRTYAVIERRYALFPNKEGELRIPQQELNAVIGGSVSRFGFDLEPFGQRSQRIRIASDEKIVVVKPLPDGQAEAAWLPASQLTLSDGWADDQNRIHVGEPLLRKIQLAVEGVPAARLPEIRMATISGFNIYPEKPELSTETTESGMISQRTETLALVPTQAGAYTLPKVSVKWWDTLNKRYQVAELPEKTLTVLPALSTGQALTDSMSISEQALFGSEKGAAQGVTAGVQSWWQYLALFSTFAWLLTLVYLWSTRNRVGHGKQKTKDDSNPSLRHAYQQLKAACVNNDAVASKQALEKWLSVRFPDIVSGSLIDKAVKLNSNELIQEINQLNNSLYGQAGSSEWQGQDLLSVVNELDKLKNDDAQDLAPLYPRFG